MVSQFEREPAAIGTGFDQAYPGIGIHIDFATAATFRDARDELSVTISLTTRNCVLLESLAREKFPLALRRRNLYCFCPDGFRCSCAWRLGISNAQAWMWRGSLVRARRKLFSRQRFQQDTVASRSANGHRQFIASVSKCRGGGRNLCGSRFPGTPWSNPGSNRSRLALEWEPSRASGSSGESFVVDTPSASAVDLGCAYTLHVNDDGSGTLRTTLVGWASQKTATIRLFPLARCA